MFSLCFSQWHQLQPSNAQTVEKYKWKNYDMEFPPLITMNVFNGALNFLVPFFQLWDVLSVSEQLYFIQLSNPCEYLSTAFSTFNKHSCPLAAGLLVTIFEIFLKVNFLTILAKNFHFLQLVRQRENTMLMKLLLERAHLKLLLKLIVMQMQNLILVTII